MEIEDKTPGNYDTIRAIKCLAKPRKLTYLWNRRHSERAGVVAKRAWLISEDLWLVENEVLFLFDGPDCLATGRADVLTELVKRLF